MSEAGSGRGVAMAAGLVVGLGLAFLALVVVGAIGGGVWWALSVSDPANTVPEPGAAPASPADPGPVEPAPAVPEPAPEGPAPSDPSAPRKVSPAPGPSPAPSPAPPSAPTPGGGEIKVITTPPGATVSIDGVARGRTPLKIELDAGAHTVSLVLGKAEATVTKTVGGDARWCFVESGKKLVEGPCS